MCKRFFSAAIVVSLLLMMFAVVPTASALTSGDFGYVVKDDGTARITDYSGSAETLVIPSRLGGYTVTEIGEDAFGFSYTLQDVTIPDTVRVIDALAFEYCDSITSVTFGRSVEQIGESAFWFCMALTEITLPDSLCEMGDWVFSGCSALSEIDFPDQAVRIGSYVFEDTAWYLSQPAGLIFAGQTLYTVKGDCPASVTIPDGTLAIADSAFSAHTALTSVTIPDSVRIIGWAAFFGCTGLSDVYIPDTVEFIGELAFGYCNTRDSSGKVVRSAIEGFGITANVNTVAESYAATNGIGFSALNETTILGDADNDYLVSIDDVTLIQRVLANLASDPFDRISRHGDVSADGLDITDATYIQQYLAHYTVRYAIGK